MIEGRRGPLSTLRGRVMLAITAGLLTATVLFTVVAAGLIRSQSQMVARGELDRQTVALATTLGQQTAEQATRGEALQIDSQAYLDVIGGPRTRIYYSGNPLSPVARQPSAEIPGMVMISPVVLARDGVQRVEFADPVTGDDLEGSIAPVTVGQEAWGYLVLARPPGDFASPWGDVAERVLLAAGIGLAVSLLVSLFLIGRITRPLTAMKRATHRVAEGNLRTQLGPTGTRELDELAADFNSMVRELARRDGATREFLMRITHDLRTPLTAIRGHAAALADGVVPPDGVDRSLNAILSESGRLEGLVADLLDLARLDADRFRVELSPMDVGTALRDAVAAVAAQATRSGVTVRATAADGLPVIVTDDRRVRQIVGNLLDNAIRWAAREGSVDVDARPRPGGGVLVSVRDDGPGVEPERREEIFAPFSSSDTPEGHRGAGLGLAISRELSRALGGDLHVEDAPGGGSLFVLTLPARAPERIRTPEATAGGT
ncbi:MAG: ATP-binding protein [Thermoleophilia bacterium]